jgi:hypothetical protein
VFEQLQRMGVRTQANPLPNKAISFYIITKCFLNTAFFQKAVKYQKATKPL